MILKGFLSLRFLVAGIGTHDIDISKQSDLEKYPVIPATLLTLLSQFLNSGKETLGRQNV